MCGRFVMKSTSAEIADQFGLGEVPYLTPRYNIAPTERIPIIRAPAGNRECSMARWGLIPAWSKEPKAEYSTQVRQGFYARRVNLKCRATIKLLPDILG
jgi:putative SOS response-associated peptidase YedK